MHELGITRNVVAIVSERAQGQRVLRVTLEVGRLSGMFSEAIRFCFDVCSKSTPLAGAVLAGVFGTAFGGNWLGRRLSHTLTDRKSVV